MTLFLKNVPRRCYWCGCYLTKRGTREMVTA